MGIPHLYIRHDIHSVSWATFYHVLIVSQHNIFLKFFRSLNSVSRACICGFVLSRSAFNLLISTPSIGTCSWELRLLDFLLSGRLRLMRGDVPMFCVRVFLFTSISCVHSFVDNSVPDDRGGLRGGGGVCVRTSFLSSSRRLDPFWHSVHHLFCVLGTFPSQEYPYLWFCLLVLDFLICSAALLLWCFVIVGLRQLDFLAEERVEHWLAIYGHHMPGTDRIWCGQERVHPWEWSN